MLLILQKKSFESFQNFRHRNGNFSSMQNFHHRSTAKILNGKTKLLAPEKGQHVRILKYSCDDSFYYGEW